MRSERLPHPARFPAKMPSTVIRRFDYDLNAAALTVTFTTGRRYVYESVPEQVAREFAAAFSKGRYFNDRIRDRYLFHELPRAA